MALDRKPQEQDKYVVRFPDGMRDRIAREAKTNGRSMNAEIIARLERSFNNPDPQLLEAYEGIVGQQQIILELIDLAGIKLPKRMRQSLEKFTRLPGEDVD